jgi:hypothetical protein
MMAPLLNSVRSVDGRVRLQVKNDSFTLGLPVYCFNWMMVWTRARPLTPKAMSETRRRSRSKNV